MSEIQPALTKKDWGDVREAGDLQMFVMNTANIPPRFLPAAHGHRPQRMLALANHLMPDGDRLKITRADVDILRTEAERQPPASIHAFALEQIAAKLAALLPPEGA